LNQNTRKIINEFSPMWTNKQVWEFEQINENLTFDMIYVESGKYDENLWKSKSSHLDSDVRDVVIRTFDNLLDGDELWISSKGTKALDEKHVPYLMATIVDTMMGEEACLNLRIDRNCLVISIDGSADLIDCKEFFEEFYHLAIGFQYPDYKIHTGIPEDETEADMHITRLRDDFDKKMKEKLGDIYLNKNIDPETNNAED